MHLERLLKKDSHLIINSTSVYIMNQVILISIKHKSMTNSMLFANLRKYIIELELLLSINILTKLVPTRINSLLIQMRSPTYRQMQILKLEWFRDKSINRHVKIYSTGSNKKTFILPRYYSTRLLSKRESIYLVVIW